MGRLTDDMLAVLGVKPSDRVKTDGSSSVTPSRIEATSPQDGTSPQTEKENPENLDCISCKVIGTTTMAATSLFVYYYAFKNARTFTGRKKVAVYGQGICLGTLFLTLAISRAMDLGPFDQTKKDELIGERITSELTTAAEWLGIKKN